MMSFGFAVAVSKDQHAISEYENGKRKLPATDLSLFSQVLNVPLLYFYNGEVKIDDLDRLPLQAFKRLPDIDPKQAAIQILRIFSDSLKRNSP